MAKERIKQDIDALSQCGLSGILTTIGCLSLVIAFFLWKVDMWIFTMCFFGASGLNKGLKILDKRMGK